MQAQAPGPCRAEACGRAPASAPGRRPIPVGRRLPPGVACGASTPPTARAADYAPSQSPAAQQLIIRPATEADWWAIAGLHVDSFFPGARLFNPLLRLDRVMGLQVGYENANPTRPGMKPRGEFVCLVAEAAGAPADPPPPRKPGWPAAWLPPSMWGAFTPDPAGDAGVVGAVVVDAQASHVPPRTRRGGGTVRLEPRAGLAYISNLAVAPGARRAGVGAALVRAAEERAWEWGCHGLALHVNARDNGAAADLYKRAGFRLVGPGSEGGGSGLGGLLGPTGQPLSLMLKVRPRRGGGWTGREAG